MISFLLGCTAWQLTITASVRTGVCRSAAGNLALLRGRYASLPVGSLLSSPCLFRDLLVLGAGFRCHMRRAYRDVFELSSFLTRLHCCAVRATPNIALRLTTLPPSPLRASPWRPLFLSVFSEAACLACRSRLPRLARRSRTQ